MNRSHETEVLIIGFGGAGAVAAITAHENGADILVTEKLNQGGGNTNTALGGFLNIKDLDKGLNYLESLCFRAAKAVEPEMLRTYAEECFKNRDWLENMGARTHRYGGASFPQLPDSDYVEKCMITGKNTEDENSFWSFLRNNVEKRKIPVWYNAGARQLLTGPNGEVIGAVINKNGRSVSVKASRAVILTCGGFEFNDWMKMNFLKGYPYFSLGTPGNTGDGIKMAQRVGAELWHTFNVSVTLGFKTPEFEAAFFLRPPSTHFIYVDKSARRFASEYAEIHAYNFIVDYFDPHSLEYPRIPCFMIFDEKARRSGPMIASSLGYNRGKYKWSKNNSEEIKRGWIIADESIAGLAEKTGLSPKILEDSVKRYNNSCSTGKDIEFQRPENKLAAIGPGPYYAMKLWPCLINTQGGPRRNLKAQVLYPDGSPIPNLYSAGELGSIFGLLYQGAGNLGECLAFGRIAGREAAMEKRKYNPNHV